MGKKEPYQRFCTNESWQLMELEDKIGKESSD
jgi:hypothetical protein